MRRHIRSFASFIAVALILLTQNPATAKSVVGEGLRTETPGWLEYQGAPVEEFQVGALLFSDRQYTITECPADYEKLSFLRVPVDGKKTIICTRAGTVWFLTTPPQNSAVSQAATLQEQGFAPVAMAKVHLFDFPGGRMLCALYQKDCAEGETITIGRWAVPLVIGVAADTEAKENPRALNPSKPWPDQISSTACRNILFIITDQLFADAMSCRMRNQFLSTPAMDQLAHVGMLFTRAYSPNPLCMPARNSLFTGRYPHETGVTKNDEHRKPLDPDEFVNMGRYFRNAGYEAAYSGKWHLCYEEKATETHGFEFVTGSVKGDGDAGVTEGAVKFLARPHDKPFLLVASFMNPHNICEWTRRIAGRNQVLSCGEIGEPPPLDQLPPLPDNFALPKGEPDGMTFMRQAYQVESGPFPVAKFSEEDWRKQRWGYYRMVEKVDAEIGKVLAALDTAGLAENTLIIFTSDHGECAGAHGFNQKTVLYEESARVPLIIAFGSKTHGGITDKLVNTGVDILPTMLDFAGLEIPKKLPGLSLMPLVLGKPVATWRDYLVVENDMSQAGKINGFTPTMKGRMVRTERYKYCVFENGNQRESLVDLQSDPGEMVNLATDPNLRAVLLQHRELLARFGRDHNDPFVDKLLADDVKLSPFPGNPDHR